MREDGSAMRVSLGVSLASRGLTSLTLKPNGTLILKQTSWQKVLRAPAQKPGWSLPIPSGATLFPTADPLAHVRFGSCAVVGSSGGILSPTPPCGREIDSHDAVWRLNAAPVRGYERYVGTRETVRVLNAAHPGYLYRLPGAMPPHWGVRPADGSPIIIVSDATSPSSAEQWVQMQRRFTASAKSARPLATFVLKDHSLLNYYLALHADRRQKSDTTTPKPGRGPWRPDYPSTGLLAVMLATLTCRSVSLYGFSLHAGRDYKRFPSGSCEHMYHYWEGLSWRNLLVAHNLTIEADIIRGLELAGVVTCDARGGGGPGQTLRASTARAINGQSFNSRTASHKHQSVFTSPKARQSLLSSSRRPAISPSGSKRAPKQRDTSRVHSTDVV